MMKKKNRPGCLICRTITWPKGSWAFTQGGELLELRTAIAVTVSLWVQLWANVYTHINWGTERNYRYENLDIVITDYGNPYLHVYHIVVMRD